MSHRLILVGLLVLTGCATHEARVTFVVVPDSALAAGETIYLTGDGAALGQWAPDAVALEAADDGSWTRELSFPPGSDVSFKITRGSWQTEAVAADGTVPMNARLTANRDTTITIRVESWKDVTHRIEGQITGEVRYHTGLEAQGLLPRDAIVWLPPSYGAEPDRRYPVLYMHDGQNVFDPRTSYTHVDWQVDEVADSLIRRGSIEEVIVVAVTNTPDRGEEYDHTEKGRAYLRFLVDDLKPMIDSTYRTRPDAANTGIMGSSMGGLISFLAVWHHPDVFSRAACLSPVFRENLLREVRRREWNDGDVRLYIDNGGDQLDNRLQPGVESMLAVLQERGFEMGKNLDWYRAEGAAHNEAAWAVRVWRPLEFLFGTESTTKDISG